jgi:ribosomal protein S28E/S33
MVGVRPIAQSHHETGGQGKIYMVKAILLEAQSSGRIFGQLRKMSTGVTSPEVSITQ